MNKKSLRITFYITVPNFRALGPIIQKKTFFQNQHASLTPFAPIVLMCSILQNLTQMGFYVRNVILQHGYTSSYINRVIMLIFIS